MNELLQELRQLVGDEIPWFFYSRYTITHIEKVNSFLIVVVRDESWRMVGVPGYHYGGWGLYFGVGTSRDFETHTESEAEDALLRLRQILKEEVLEV